LPETSWVLTLPAPYPRRGATDLSGRTSRPRTPPVLNDADGNASRVCAGRSELRSIISAKAFFGFDLAEAFGLAAVLLPVFFGAGFAFVLGCGVVRDFMMTPQNRANSHTPRKAGASCLR
jgi:hypothetical protein